MTREEEEQLEDALEHDSINSLHSEEMHQFASLVDSNRQALEQREKQREKTLMQFMMQQDNHYHSRHSGNGGGGRRMDTNDAMLEAVEQLEHDYRAEKRLRHKLSTTTHNNNNNNLHSGMMANDGHVSGLDDNHSRPPIPGPLQDMLAQRLVRGNGGAAGGGGDSHQMRNSSMVKNERGAGAGAGAPAEHPEYDHSLWEEMVRYVKEKTKIDRNILDDINIRYIKERRIRSKIKLLSVYIRHVIHYSGNAYVQCGDRTGTMHAMVAKSMIDQHQKITRPGVVMLLRKVAVYWPSPLNPVLIITRNSVANVFFHGDASDDSSMATTPANRNVSPTSVDIVQHQMMQPQLQLQVAKTVHDPIRHTTSNMAPHSMGPPQQQQQQQQQQHPQRYNTPNVRQTPNSAVLNSSHRLRPQLNNSRGTPSTNQKKQSPPHFEHMDKVIKLSPFVNAQQRTTMQSNVPDEVNHAMSEENPFASQVEIFSSAPTIASSQSSDDNEKDQPVSKRAKFFHVDDDCDDEAGETDDYAPNQGVPAENPNVGQMEEQQPAFDFDEEYSRALLRHQGHLSQQEIATSPANPVPAQAQEQAPAQAPTPDIFADIDFSLIDRQAKERKRRQEQPQHVEDRDIDYDMNGTTTFPPPDQVQNQSKQSLSEQKMDAVFDAALNAFHSQRQQQLSTSEKEKNIIASPTSDLNVFGQDVNQEEEDESLFW